MEEQTAINKEKLSYEQLENVAHQLSEQSRTLYAKLKESNMQNLFKRLDYLFKVLENETSFPASFVDKCADEIQELLEIPEKDTEETEE